MQVSLNHLGYVTFVLFPESNWHSRNIRNVVCDVDQLVNNNNLERTTVYTNTHACRHRAEFCRTVAREFDDGITSHWFPVYNAPEINVRPAGPPVNAAGPHDSYARLIYLYVNSATLWPIDTPDIARSDALLASLRAMSRIFMPMIARYYISRDENFTWEKKIIFQWFSTFKSRFIKRKI